MQFKLLALSAFAAAASAQHESSSISTLVVTSSTGLNQLSIYSVLATALPSSLVAEALTNTLAASKAIASEFRSGDEPSWFTALPTGVQSYLLHQGSTGTGLAGGVNSSMILNGTHAHTTVKHHTTAQQTKTTQKTTHLTHHVAQTSQGQKATKGAAGAASSSSTGGASLPTAIVGAGLAGAVGIVGLFAL